MHALASDLGCLPILLSLAFGGMRLEADTVVVGGGTAGAVVAGLLSEASERSVLLLEAGPDYGPFAEARWPADLLDSTENAYSHDWGYDSGETYPGRTVAFPRAGDRWMLRTLDHRGTVTHY